MSFALLRASVRRTALRAAAPRAAPNTASRVAFRKFSTPPPAPEPKSGNGLIIGVLAAVVIGGGGYYYLSSSEEASTAVKSGIQAVKAKAKFTPTQEDYQKVNGVLFRSVLSLIECRSTTKSPKLLMKLVTMTVSIHVYEGKKTC
jgi:cytochrome c peroxidase